MSEEELSSLIERLNNADEVKRRKAAKKLGKLGDFKAVKPLIKALKDNDYLVRSNAAKSLSILGDSNAAEKLLPLFKEDTGALKWFLANWLAEYNDKQLITPLIDALKGENHFVRFSAAKKLSKFDSPRVIEPLIDALLHDEYEGVRWVAAQSLANLKKDIIIEAFIKGLKDDDWSIRFLIARSLGNFGDLSATLPLIECLKDERSEIRYVVAESLGKLNDERAVDPLIEALKDSDVTVRCSAAFSLGKLGYIKAVEPLIETLEDKDRDLKYAAIKALGEIGDKGAIRPLIKLLNDEDSEIRKAIVESLAALINLRVLFFLFIALKDKDYAVRHSAATKLIKLRDLEVIRHIEDSFRVKGLDRRRVRLLKVSSEMIFFWFNKASAYLELKYYKKAILLFRKIIKMDERNIEAWLSMGIAYFYLKDYRETFECFETLNELGYENVVLNYLLSQKNIFIRGNPSDSAITTSKERLKSIKLPITSFWHKIGEKEIEFKNFEDAIKYFEKVLEIDPKYVNSWIKLSSVYKKLNDPQKSIEILDQALEINPQNTDIWFEKAKTYGIFIKDYPKAMNALNKIIEIDPNNRVAISALVKVQDKFENLFSDVFEIPQSIQEFSEEEEVLRGNEFIAETQDVELVKSKLKKYSKIYKSIHLSKLAEKCRYPVSELENILEELILNEEIKGYISNDYYIQDTIANIGNLDRLRSLDELDKIRALDIRKIQIFLSSIDEIRLKELANKFEINLREMESWLRELLDRGIIKGEISDSKFIPLKKVNYEELEEYQLISGNLCAICYTNIETHAYTKCENCNTPFHKDCIIAYVDQHKRCPVCSNVFRWI